MSFKGFSPNITVTIHGNGGINPTQMSLLQAKVKQLEDEYNTKAPEQEISNDPEILEILNKLEGIKLAIECLGCKLDY
ncbi:TPA: hypothetical protein VGS93_003747 [Bacillus cereus]|nr:hypothetical protein [Bacillus cereus]